jgi:hypothetical protein
MGRTSKPKPARAAEATPASAPPWNPEAYAGSRDASGAVVVMCDGQALDPRPSQKVWNHSPDGFEWGYGGSGPAQLALAILLREGIGTGAAEALHQRFKTEVIARLPRLGAWTLTGEEVRRWIARRRAEEEGQYLSATPRGRAGPAGFFVRGG